MANNIHTGGPTVIMNSTSSALGAQSGYQVLPRVRDLTFQTMMAGTSAGVTVTATLNIDVSNDGTNWTAAPGTTMTINGVTPQTAIGRIATSLEGAWAYVRANLTAASSSTDVGTGYNIKVSAAARQSY